LFDGDGTAAKISQQAAENIGLGLNNELSDEKVKTSDFQIEEVHS